MSTWLFGLKGQFPTTPVHFKQLRATRAVREPQQGRTVVQFFEPNQSAPSAVFCVDSLFGWLRQPDGTFTVWLRVPDSQGISEQKVQGNFVVSREPYPGGLGVVDLLEHEKDEQATARFIGEWVAYYIRE